MSKQDENERSTLPLFKWAIIPLVITWLFLSLSFIVPLLDSTSAPFFVLNSLFSDAVYWLSQSGGKFGAPVVGLLMLAVLVGREGISVKRKWTETCLVVLVISLLAGGGAVVNEHVIKAELKIPRPNILWLADGHVAGKSESSRLGVSAEQFYNTGDKEARRLPLQKVLDQQPAILQLSPLIKAHWIEETGYSFPSGHAFSAMFFAAFFLLMATSYLSGKRFLFFYVLLPWAIGVGYSRTILRLHTPADITLGGLQGLLVGICAWLLVRTLIRRFY